MSAPVRMRTIPQAVEYFRQFDEGTCINEWYIRGLVSSGALPCHRAGRRVIINLDALEAYLANPPAADEAPIRYGIRKLSR